MQLEPLPPPAPPLPLRCPRLSATRGREHGRRAHAERADRWVARARWRSGMAAGLERGLIRRATRRWSALQRCGRRQARTREMSLAMQQQNWWGSITHTYGPSIDVWARRGEEGGGEISDGAPTPCGSVGQHSQRQWRGGHSMVSAQAASEAWSAPKSAALIRCDQRHEQGACISTRRTSHYALQYTRSTAGGTEARGKLMNQRRGKQSACTWTRRSA